MPARSSGESIPSATTRLAPPEVVPATIRSASPFDWAKPLIAGLGPMNVASIAPESSASIASPPALKLRDLQRHVRAEGLGEGPVSTPTIAGAWVTFGK